MLLRLLNIFFFFLCSDLILTIKSDELIVTNDEISELYANVIIERNGGTNGTLSTSRFESYFNHLQNISHFHRDFLLDLNENDGQLSSSSSSASISSAYYRPPSDQTTLECNRQKGELSQYNLCLARTKCFTATQLLDLVTSNGTSQSSSSSSSSSEENSVVDARTLLTLCPIILQQLENENCSGSNEVLEIINLNKPSPIEVWGFGFLFVTIINLSAIFGAVLLPLMGKRFFKCLLVTLIGLAVGSLSSSAAFHLLPQAFGLVEKGSGDHKYLWTSLLVLCGIYLFFMLERFLKIFIDYKERQLQTKPKRNFSDVEVLSYTPSVADSNMRDSGASEDVEKEHLEQNNHNHNHHYRRSSKSEHKHEQIEFKQGKDSAIATVAWMIVFGDGLHNFIDGLSIGAAFNESILTGISISVAVICEELPHELGDLAVLLNSGMTVKQALLYNFLSALTCYGGLVVGTLLGELAEASIYIFAIAAGAFFYISLVDMVPEMNEEVENASKIGVCEALKVLGLQNIGWFLGTFILFTLAYYTDKLNFE